jgi:putative Ca2+/H+ antiporter (TMEM165/GDT1 family)
MERRRRVLLCIVAAVLAVGFGRLLADDVPPPDRTVAWLGFAIAAVVAFPTGYAIRWADRRLHADRAGSAAFPAVLLSAIVVAVLAGDALSHVLDPRYLMMIEAAAGALFISLVVTA